MKLIRSNVRWTIVPFTLMASTALMLVVLWQRTPFLFAALAGPLVAISLYQRSTQGAERDPPRAHRPPDGLGNHRHFHERLQRELAQADEHGGLVSLCFLDIDDFKRINDQFGHPAGDRVLSQVASRLRHGGESFRLGGDEFAVLLVGMDEQLALAATRSIVQRISDTEFGKAGAITVSAGVATFPQHSRERDSLIRLADGALYWAKEHGKNQVRLARADVAELSEFRPAANGGDQIARFSARHPFPARSIRATRSPAAIRTGLRASQPRSRPTSAYRREEVELTRLAGSLHDLGKLAIPEEILRKPAALSDAERVVIERHPQIGYRMLESLGVEPIAYWVLHHHERWDGHGYPEGLAGETIPLGARILFVADAFDAMTSARLYGDSLPYEEAVAEIERCAGSQFDPDVVNAFLAGVGARAPLSACRAQSGMLPCLRFGVGSRFVIAVFSAWIRTGRVRLGSDHVVDVTTLSSGYGLANRSR